MIARLSLVLVVVLHVLAFERGGLYQFLLFFVVWAVGMFFTGGFISRVGRPRPGDQVPTITGDNDTDLTLALIWPLGFFVVFGYWVVKKISTNA